MNRDRYQFRLQRLIGAVAIAAACFTASAENSTAEAESVETASVATQKAEATDVLVIYAGKVTTMDGDDRVINNAVVVVEDGKIVEVRKAKGYKEPEGAEVIDARDSWLVPGIVELHNHTAGALRDLNDSVYLTNPGLRTLEIVAPETEEVRRAQVGGVTAAMLIPGSGTNMSGFGTLVKMGGSSVDEVVMRAPGSIKIAQAGNPGGLLVRRRTLVHELQHPPDAGRGQGLPRGVGRVRERRERREARVQHRLR